MKEKVKRREDDKEGKVYIYGIAHDSDRGSDEGWRGVS